MKRVFAMAFLIMAVLIGFVYAGEQVFRDAKGSYIVNEYGSKGRISLRDLELKNQGKPYGITWEVQDMTQAEKDIIAAKQAQDQAVKDAQVAAEEKDKQDKEAAINKLKAFNLTEDEIQVLIK